MLLRIPRFILSLFLFLSATAAYGLASDPRLIKLVPPESRIVAGMISPAQAGQLSSFLLITRSNELDHKDFFALTGGDASRSIHAVVFVASDGRGLLSEHSLLISGHFDRDAIFRLANNGGASREQYRGVPILTVPPFARERESFKEVRWLAIPDERIAIFGSVQSVQWELDRWIANSPTDPVVLERLSRLDARDQTWCLLPAPQPGGAVVRTLGDLDPRLGALAEAGGEIQYGMHFGRDIEITVSNNPEPGTNLRTPADAPAFESLAVSHFVSGSHVDDGQAPRSVRVKLRPKSYERWLAGFATGGRIIDREPFR